MGTSEVIGGLACDMRTADYVLLPALWAAPRLAQMFRFL
jgi:hypothetical protein